MKIRPLRSALHSATLVSLPLALLALSGSVFARAQDPINNLFISRGLSPLTVAAQNKAVPGGYVAYDTQNSHSAPVWFPPVPGQVVPPVQSNALPIHIPATSAAHQSGLDLALHLLQIEPSGSFARATDLQFGEIVLIPKGLSSPNDYYGMLSKGSALEREIEEFGDTCNSPICPNQHLYGVLTVYYTTGINITSKSGTALALSSGEQLKACSGVTAPAAAGGNPLSDNATGAASQAVDKLTGGFRSGSGRYCRIDGTHVEFHSDQPVPIAAELYRILPLPAGGFNLLPKVVVTEGNHTVER